MRTESYSYLTRRIGFKNIPTGISRQSLHSPIHLDHPTKKHKKMNQVIVQYNDESTENLH